MSTDRAAGRGALVSLSPVPAAWTGGQLALSRCRRWRCWRCSICRAAPSSASRQTATTAFNRRYVAALALGPFAVTTIVAAVLGRQPLAMWGYPLWTFVPLARADVSGRRRSSRAAAQVCRRRAGGADRVSDRLCRSPSSASRSCATGRRRRSSPAASSPKPSPGNGGNGPERRSPMSAAPSSSPTAAAARDAAAPGNSPPTMSRSIRRTGRTSSCKASSSSVPGSMPRTSNAAARSLVWQPPDDMPELPENIRRAFPRAELQPPLTLPRQHALSPARANSSITPSSRRALTAPAGGTRPAYPPASRDRLRRPRGLVEIERNRANHRRAVCHFGPIMRLGAIFVAVCMVVIAASAGATVYLGFGFSGDGSGHRRALGPDRARALQHRLRPAWACAPWSAASSAICRAAISSWRAR